MSARCATELYPLRASDWDVRSRTATRETQVAGVVDVEADACLAELGGDYGAVDVVHGGGAR